MASHTAKRKLFALPRILPLRAPVALEDDLRLKAERDQLRTQVGRLQKQVETVTQDLYLQFVRIAHMQAVLDEGRRISRNCGATSPREGVPPDVNHPATGSTAMAGITDAPQQSTHRTTFTQAKRCPHCHSVWLTQLFAGGEHNWYRCQQCGDTFAIDRPAFAKEPA